MPDITSAEEEEMQGGYGMESLAEAALAGHTGLSGRRPLGTAGYAPRLGGKDGLAGCHLWPKMEGPCAGAGGALCA